jgi:hypothetical protein
MCNHSLPHLATYVFASRSSSATSASTKTTRLGSATLLQRHASASEARISADRASPTHDRPGSGDATRQSVLSHTRPAGQMTLRSTRERSRNGSPETLRIAAAASSLRRVGWLSSSTLSSIRDAKFRTSNASSYPGPDSWRIRAGQRPWKHCTHRSLSHTRSSCALGIDATYRRANVPNSSPSTWWAVYCWSTLSTPSGARAGSHTELWVLLQRDAVISEHRSHARHEDVLPGLHVVKGHCHTSAPPLHSCPAGHGAHSPDSSLVPALHRLHSPLASTYPASHVQSASLKQRSRHPEFIRHGAHMPAPRCEYMSLGHCS